MGRLAVAITGQPARRGGVKAQRVQEHDAAADAPLTQPPRQLRRRLPGPREEKGPT